MKISAKLQAWKCHKAVRAGKIGNISSLDVISTTLAVETPLGLVHCTMSQEWMARHMPEVGGYLVAYDDKYVSYSPAKAFEDGYHKVSSPFLNPPPVAEHKHRSSAGVRIYGFDPNNPEHAKAVDEMRRNGSSPSASFLRPGRSFPPISHETQALIWGNLHEKIMGGTSPFDPPKDPLNRAERALYDNLTLSLARSLDPLASL